MWSEWIIAETWYVLAERLVRGGTARGDISRQAKAMLRHLLPVTGLVSVAHVPVSAPPSPLADPDDAPVWDTAIIAGARYVVTHNTTDLPALVEEHRVNAGREQVVQRHTAGGIEFLTAIEFIEDVLGQEAEAILG